jgi:bifunctional DNA-binding transcriptional regulator/antitoxin component of YhaV-PrlF toxin-antitoxin module
MTVPKEVRDVLDIQEGNLVKCKIAKMDGVWRRVE